MSITQKVVFGANQSHYYSQNDEKGRCPSCYNNNTTKIGVLTIEGTPQDLCKCNSCNKLYSGPDGGIRSLVEEAMTVHKTQNVGFVATGTTTGVIDMTSLTGDITSLNGVGPSNQGHLSAPIQLDYNVHSKFDSMNSHLSSINSNMYSLMTEIQNLNKTVASLAQQNKDMMEKLATDPLNGMRKAVNGFNLK